MSYFKSEEWKNKSDKDKIETCKRLAKEESEKTGVDYREILIRFFAEESGEVTSENVGERMLEAHVSEQEKIRNLNNKQGR